MNNLEREYLSAHSNLGDMLQHIKWDKMKSEHWIEGGHNVESNQRHLVNLNEFYIKVVESENLYELFKKIQ